MSKRIHCLCSFRVSENEGDGGLLWGSTLKDKKALDLAVIEILSRVVDYGSMTRAAQDLGVSQSFVSKKLASLEAFLGAPIFERSKYGVQLRPAAADFYKSSTRFLNATQAFRDTNRPEEENGFRVRLGASSAPSRRLMPKLMVDFHRDNPKCLLSLTAGSTPEIIRAVENGKLDIAIVGRKVRDPSIHCVLFCEDELCLVTAANNCVLPRSINSLSELQRIPLVLEQHDSATSADLESCLQNYGCKLGDLNIKLRCGLSESTIAVLLSSDLGAIASRLSIEDYLETNVLREIKLTSVSFPRSIYLIANKQSFGKHGVAKIDHYLKSVSEQLCGSV